MQRQRRVVAADVDGIDVRQQRQMHYRGRCIVDMDAVGPMLGLHGRARRPVAQPLDQLQAARPVQAGQPQRGGRQPARGQRRFGLQQHLAVEPLRRGRRVFVHPAALVFAIDGAGRHEHHALEPRRIQYVQHGLQAINEDTPVDRCVARSRGRQVDQAGHARGQGGQAGRLRDVALQPPDAAVVVLGRMAAQRMDLVAARQEAPGDALAQVAAANE
ncbi:hypothetical protein G6F22_015043 [Rhizopus arrhizus]|nr:hypothetical protein G6F22_015043 [Rhizopus arrhizus]